MTPDDATTDAGATLAERLERGELVVFPPGTVPLPPDGELEFLRTRHLRHRAQHAIHFDPATSRVGGQRPSTPDDAEHLTRAMRRFSDELTAWLATRLPEYAPHWTHDRATLRPEEEAIRSLRHNARNDLLHIDAFPTRPSAGRRILRLFVNINTTEPRVWVTSVRFPELLARFQITHRIPPRSAAEWREPLPAWQRLLHGDWSGRPAYDALMLKVQQFLRSDDHFQEHAPRQFHHFPPGSAWLLLADGLAHAVLRGQHALEHSYFVPQSALVLPQLSPLSQLVAAGQSASWSRAG